MKQIIYNIAIFFAVCSPGLSMAQGSGVGNQDQQPAWGPVGYDYADNYYLPDINVYYNVPKQVFVYSVDGLWVTSAKLPASVADYNLYSGRKVVMNTREPWLNHSANMALYSVKADCNNQLVNRDAYDMWNFHVTTYSGRMPKVVTTVDSTYVTKTKSFAGYKRVKVKTLCGKVVTVKRPIYKKVDNTASKLVKRTTTTTNYGGLNTTACVAPDVTNRSSCVRNENSNTWSCTSSNSYGGYKPYNGVIFPPSPCTSCVKQFSPDDYSCVTTENFRGYMPSVITKSTTCKNPGIKPIQ